MIANHINSINGKARMLLLAFPLLIFGIFSYQIVPLKFSLLLGVIAFPFVLKPGNQKESYRFAIAALISLSGLLLVRSNALYYFATAFILLHLIENSWGRINNLPILLVAIISPVVSTIVYIWSFPIRLKLTEWAVDALQFIGTDITASGNVLSLNGYTFSVDPACMGLKMIVSSLVVAVIILAYFEKKQSHAISLLKASSMLAMVLLLAIFANFIRLLTLVLFYILPENPLHDIVGLISLAVYVLIPFYFLAKFLFGKNNSEIITIQAEKPPTYSFTKKGIAIFCGLLCFQIFTGFQFLEEPIDDITQLVHFEKAGYQKSITDNGVLKLQNEQALIYVKAPVKFFQGSHDPRFCWRGSGYAFSSVKIENIGTKKVYSATLKKESDQLYSAWWYQNTTSTTPNEWDWRWGDLQGEDGYYLVNINCETRNALEEIVKNY